MDFVLGLDAGNSKTLAVIANSEGQLFGAAQSKCGDISNREIGTRNALTNVIDAAEKAIKQAGIKASDLKAKVFSMAGADWPEDYGYLRASLNKNNSTKNAIIMNDALGALRSTSAAGTGVAIVCGTYAVSSARNAEGKSYYSSFWQETGGAYKLGQTALTAVYRAELGIDPATQLRKAILDAFKKTEVNALLHHLTARNSNVPESEIATLAPLVFQAAAREDQAAKTIINNEAKTLVEYALIAAQKVKLNEPFTIYLTGGVFNHPSKLLEEAIRTRVYETHPSVKVIRSQTKPIVGALMAAFESLKMPLAADLFNQLTNANFLKDSENTLIHLGGD